MAEDQSSTIASAEAIGSRSRDVGWYLKDLSDVKPSARDLLENYSKIPPEDVVKHVYEIVRHPGATL
jgi:hypothetical protein